MYDREFGATNHPNLTYKRPSRPSCLLIAGDEQTQQGNVVKLTVVVLTKQSYYTAKVARALF